MFLINSSLEYYTPVECSLEEIGILKADSVPFVILLQNNLDKIFEDRKCASYYIDSRPCKYIGLMIP